MYGICVGLVQESGVPHHFVALEQSISQTMYYGTIYVKDENIVGLLSNYIIKRSSCCSHILKTARPASK